MMNKDRFCELLDGYRRSRFVSVDELSDVILQTMDDKHCFPVDVLAFDRLLLSLGERIPQGFDPREHDYNLSLTSSNPGINFGRRGRHALAEPLKGYVRDQLQFLNTNAEFTLDEGASVYEYLLSNYLRTIRLLAIREVIKDVGSAFDPKCPTMVDEELIEKKKHGLVGVKLRGYELSSSQKLQLEDPFVRALLQFPDRFVISDQSGILFAGRGVFVVGEEISWHPYNDEGLGFARKALKRRPVWRNDKAEKEARADHNAFKSTFYYALVRAIDDKLASLPDDLLSAVELRARELSQRHSVRIYPRFIRESFALEPAMDVDDLDVVDRFLLFLSPLNMGLRSVIKQHSNEFKGSELQARQLAETYFLSSFKLRCRDDDPVGAPVYDSLPLYAHDMVAMKSDFRRYASALFMVLVRELYDRMDLGEGYSAVAGTERKQELLSAVEIGFGSQKIDVVAQDFVISALEYRMALLEGREPDLPREKRAYVAKIFT